MVNSELRIVNGEWKDVAVTVTDPGFVTVTENNNLPYSPLHSLSHGEGRRGEDKQKTYVSHKVTKDTKKKMCLEFVP